MAKKRASTQAKSKAPGLQNTSSVDSRMFTKGMSKDMSASFQNKEQWFHARNAANNSVDGDVGLIGNEPANLECANIPYTIIGAIHLYQDSWVLFGTDDINSEIGLFDDSKCEYTSLVNDTCLSFNKLHLIVGASKENFDCTWQIYWDDGNNPSRTLNINDIPYIQNEVSEEGADCVIYEDTSALDCEKIRIAPLLDTPCVHIEKSISGGQLRNGSYQAFIAYTVNEQKVTDYIGVSNVQSLFDHRGNSGALKINVTNLDIEFDYYELVILSNNQENTVAKKLGLYSTEQSDIEIDYIDQSLVSVPLELIPLMNPAYEKSDAMYIVNDWLIRQGPTEKFDFNYQPLANQIRSKWVSAEMPASYYHKGGNKTGLMRDEQYAFFIRWIFNTGDRSSSYHIPGRPPSTNGITQFGQVVNETATAAGPNTLSGQEKNFQVYNTATIIPGSNEILEDGTNVIAKGYMGYWESTEKYPATRPDIWNSSSDPIWGNVSPDNDLCGKYIRHHKIPTEELSSDLHLSTTNGNSIRIIGVEFENIKPPLDNDGNILTDIVGYEILRGSREGHRSILAKGIFKNMREYDIPAGGQTLGNSKGLYPNYPYNDLRPDIYFHDGNQDNRTDGCDSWSQSVFSNSGFSPLTGYKKDYFTFHSPELNFRKPFLNAFETRIYGEVSGQSVGHFIKSENHPQNKLIRNGGAVIAAIIGIGYAINQVQGTKGTVYNGETFGPFPPPLGPYNVFGGPAGVGSSYPNPGYILALGVFEGVGVATSISDIIIDALISDLTQVASIWDGGVTDWGVNYGDHLLDKNKGLIPGIQGGRKDTTYEYNTSSSNLPKVFRALLGVPLGAANIAIGAQEIIDLIYNLVKEEDFAFKYNSHGFYNNFTPSSSNNIFRTKNLNANYIGSSFQQFQGFKINNLFRPDTVAIATADELNDPSVIDKSRFAIGGDADNSYGDTYIRSADQEQKKSISARYGGLKFEFENQYGQIDGIKQIQMKGCTELIVPEYPNQPFTSKPIFGGDVYVNRYTEKNIMPIFADFLNGQPDQFTYDYLQRVNIPYPRFWMDTRKYDTTALGLEVATLGLGSSSDPLPNDLFYLDRGSNSCPSTIEGLLGLPNDPNPSFAMRYAYMYTHVNGVQDFFVESEYNLSQRDWDDTPAKRHYDVYDYTNTDDLFHADIQKEDNFYKYDLSLSISKMITQVTSFGNVQPRDYDPYVAENCYQYYPKRLIYSLQAQKEAKKDFWRVFLPNNYKDFKSEVNVIKPISKSGAIILFPYQSPVMFQGVDQLQTDLGTKLTIGDGGLFTQPLQNIANSDLSNEYGSSESMRSVVNTPTGVYYMSQAQGKIFHYTGRLDNISNKGMKWWFNKYLPSILVRQYPELEFSKLSDNPVIGIGCQSIYDVNDDIVYFMKKDYKVKENLIPGSGGGEVHFINDGFVYKTLPASPGTPIKVGDPLYFEDASWTVSYDAKSQAWISFHDWHPELALPSINHFLTTQTVANELPTCPPGYTFNPATNLCEKIYSEVEPATVVVEEVPATVVDNTVNCTLDIVIAMDWSTSTIGPPIVAQRQFVADFLGSPEVTAGLANGTFQIGFTRWGSANFQQSFNPGGFSMQSTGLNIPAVNAWYAANPTSGTHIQSGMAHADSILNNTASSQLGNRLGQPGFTRVMIFMTDAAGTQGTTNGCQYQNLPQYNVTSVWCNTSNFPGANAQTIINQITCNTPAQDYVMIADGSQPNNTSAVISTAIAGAICGAPPTCECPEGYEVVYPDSNNNYTLPEGDCSVANPPICRKVECNCPGPAFPEASTTETGVCDDVYLTNVLGTGSPSYINFDPLTCNYFGSFTTQPSFESGSLWRHNVRCDLFSNYYGVDYPWEVEVIENTGQIVNTIRSVEYQLESYVYKGDLLLACGDDRWHDLDFNFDESIIYNSEQVSGLLKLDLTPKEDPFAALQYPIIGTNDIRILYSKEEQKYRFNQFWDITDDRGEFTGIQRSKFITQMNGYIKDLNAANLNYAKDPLQHKKFRHYYNKLLLRRNVSGDRKMLLKIANTKLNMSIR